MPTDAPATTRLSCFCALCISRCGATAVLEDDRFVALEPDPTHPTGQALCAKGRAAPELVYSAERLHYPLKRTRPKGDPDPGWQRISWEEALDETAARLRQIAAEDGPESIVFSAVSPSTSASSDVVAWIERLMRAYGSPNLCAAMELCGWGRYLATAYTYGDGVPGVYMPDLEQAGCILFWGYNPNNARLVHATATMAARKRGARLIVIDPQRTGIAKKADLWLQVRPGTDGALALGIAHVMIARGWYDDDFIRTWSNGPLLVRADNGRLLTAADLDAADSADRYVAWDESGGPLIYDPARRGYDREGATPALSGTYTLDTAQGEVVCQPAFAHVADLCRRYPPSRVEAICGVAAAQVEAAAQLLWEARPVAYYAWSGLEMQTNATQTARAVAQLYALTGSLDRPGGNVLFAAPPTAAVTGKELLSAAQRERSLGLEERPLGPPRWQHVTSDDVYRAILEQQPYPVRGLVGFGANLLLAHADSARGRRALSALDFYVHADLFMTPTAAMADIVLPVASAFEREGLKIGFEVSPAAQAYVQLRPQVVAAQGEARGDMEIIFDLAVRLGLGAHFRNGDVDAAYNAQLAPSGITVDALRASPGGISLPLETEYRKYATAQDGAPRGFKTPTGLVELYSEAMRAHGYPPLPAYEEPLVGPVSRPELIARYPLILTCAKSTLFCQTQHRSIPTLRRRAPDPEVALHPQAAAARGISGGDWVQIETPHGSVRARAHLDDTLQPDVVVGQHGWWQAAPAIGAPGYDPFGSEGANYNLIIGNEAIDPVSGSVPHRAYLCQIWRVDD